MTFVIDCPWFFCAELRFGAATIAVIGILQPVWFVRAARRYRSELFLALYAAVGLWSALSVMLLVGVLKAWPALLAAWCVCSLVLLVLVVALLVLVTLGFCILHMKNSAVAPVIGIICYIIFSLYFVCVVNTHRRELLGHRVLRDGLENRADERSHYRVKASRRGSCVVPAPPQHGRYVVRAPDAAAAQAAGARHHVFRLLLMCMPRYLPRARNYTECISGGWTLPLPECVLVDGSISVKNEHYWYDDERGDKEVTDSRKCVAPPPPKHGYYVQAPDQWTGRRYMSVTVACTPMHVIVGRTRLTCRDGVWDYPLPQCVFVDSAMCGLRRRPRVRHTCLRGAQYALTYACDGALVPHGTVVEPRCEPGHYVWGSFTYMLCVDGQWMPPSARNLTCVSLGEIYQHYSIQERIAMFAKIKSEEEALTIDPARSATTTDPVIT